jgi:hypothetical protein
VNVLKCILVQKVCFVKYKTVWLYYIEPFILYGGTTFGMWPVLYMAGNVTIHCGDAAMVTVHV